MSELTGWDGVECQSFCSYHQVFIFLQMSVVCICAGINRNTLK